MNLAQLPKTTTKGKRRLGQGHGSGRVKTAGRGTKGQKARGKIPLFFEGGALSLIKRMPFHRGKGRNKIFRKKPLVVNLAGLSAFPMGAVVDMEALIKAHIVDKKEANTYGVKILGDGIIKTSLTIKLPVSKQAATKIEKAGGTIAQ